MGLRINKNDDSGCVCWTFWELWDLSVIQLTNIMRVLVKYGNFESFQDWNRIGTQQNIGIAYDELANKQKEGYSANHSTFVWVKITKNWKPQRKWSAIMIYVLKHPILAFPSWHITEHWKQFISLMLIWMSTGNVIIIITTIIIIMIIIFLKMEQNDLKSPPKHRGPPACCLKETVNHGQQRTRHRLFRWAKPESPESYPRKSCMTGCTITLLPIISSK